MQAANLQDPTFIDRHAQLRDALKGNGIDPYRANKTAQAILTGQVNDKALGILLRALDPK